MLVFTCIYVLKTEGAISFEILVSTYTSILKTYETSLSETFISPKFHSENAGKLLQKKADIRLHSTPETETAFSSETLISTYRSRWCHNREGHHLR
jgi:hypothetical protein